MSLRLYLRCRISVPCSLPFGETVLRWDGAKRATDTDANQEEVDTQKARKKLDACLDFRGNTLFATTSGACMAPASPHAPLAAQP